MPWRDRLLQASFRGVEFGVADHEAKIAGRRVQTHEYPGRDVPYTEDLGKRTKQFGIEGYVVGDDYAAQLDRLIQACDMAGPGELVHPYRGVRQVACVELNVNERTSEGRMARLSFQFVEAGANQYPTDRANTQAVVSEQAAVARAALIEQFMDRWGL